MSRSVKGPRGGGTGQLRVTARECLPAHRHHHLARLLLAATAVGTTTTTAAAAVAAARAAAVPTAGVAVATAITAGAITLPARGPSLSQQMTHNSRSPSYGHPTSMGVGRTTLRLASGATNPLPPWL